MTPGRLGPAALTVALAALATGGCEGPKARQQPAYGETQSTSKETTGAGNAPDTNPGAGAYGSDRTGAYGSPSVAGGGRTTAGEGDRRDTLDATGGAQSRGSAESPRATKQAATDGHNACQRLERCYQRMSRDVCASDDRSCVGTFQTSSLPVDEGSCRSILSTMTERARLSSPSARARRSPGTAERDADR